MAVCSKYHYRNDRRGIDFFPGDGSGTLPSHSFNAFPPPVQAYGGVSDRQAQSSMITAEQWLSMPGIRLGHADGFGELNRHERHSWLPEILVVVVAQRVIAPLTRARSIVVPLPSSENSHVAFHHIDAAFVKSTRRACRWLVGDGEIKAVRKASKRDDWRRYGFLTFHPCRLHPHQLPHGSRVAQFACSFLSLRRA